MVPDHNASSTNQFPITDWEKKYYNFILKLEGITKYQRNIKLKALEKNPDLLRKDHFTAWNKYKTLGEKLQRRDPKDYPITEKEINLYARLLYHTEGISDSALTQLEIKKLEENPSLLRVSYFPMWKRWVNAKLEENFNKTFRDEILTANTVEECNEIYEAHIDKPYLNTLGGYKKVLNWFYLTNSYSEKKITFIQLMQERIIQICKLTNDFSPIVNSPAFDDKHKQGGMKFDIPQTPVSAQRRPAADTEMEDTALLEITARH